MRTRVALVAVASGVIGAVLGAAVTLAVQSSAMPVDPGGRPARAVPPPAMPASPDTVLAWTPGGMPPGFAERARRVKGIRGVAVVTSGTAWLTRSRSRSGAIADAPPKGLAVPLEAAGVNPSAYGAFLPPGDRGLLVELQRGHVVLGETSARLRRVGAGATLRFGDVSLRVAGVLPDEVLGAHEVLASHAVAARLGATRPRYALLDPAEAVAAKTLAARLRKIVPPGTPLRVRAPGDTPYFRHGDAVLPQVKLKEFFGEFAARPVAGGFIQVDAEWKRRHIARETVPVLGTFECARALFPQLRGALREVARRGLGYLIDDFAGCYSPRFLNRSPAAGLSHHSWGAAIDVNVPANPYGRVPRQDPRLVEIFERWGFTWGGRWLVPDGMHFEFIRPALDGGG